MARRKIQKRIDLNEEERNIDGTINISFLGEPAGMQYRSTISKNPLQIFGAGFKEEADDQDSTLTDLES